MPNLLASNQLDPDLFAMYVTEPLDYINHEPHNLVRRKYEDLLIAFKRNSVYIKLVDNVQKDTVSFVRLDTEIHHGKEYKVIKLSYSKFPQKGHIKYVFTTLLFDLNYHIMSDSLHTVPGSMNFWKKIKTLENTECRILNLSTKYSRLYVKQPDHVVWGLDEEYFTNDTINTFLVEDFWDRRVINPSLYEYISENQKKLKNKEHLRLTIRVNQDGG